MNKKIIFLDLDGTLLNDKKEVTDGNRDAINRMLEAGHYVVINTGRHIFSAKKQAAAIGLNKPGCYLIAFNGGMIYDYSKEQAIYEQPIPLEDVHMLFEEANRRNLHIQAFDDEFVLIEKHNDTDLIREYCGKALMEYHIIPGPEAITMKPVKMLAIEKGDHKNVIAFENWIHESQKGRLDAFFSSVDYLEIVKHGLNKSSALLRLCEILEIPLENTIAAGDQANDLPMIRTAHVGAAMVNGTDEVKGAADYITTRDNNHDGVAEIIDKFVFGK